MQDSILRPRRDRPPGFCILGNEMLRWPPPRHYGEERRRNRGIDGQCDKSGAGCLGHPYGRRARGWPPVEQRLEVLKIILVDKCIRLSDCETGAYHECPSY